jgi:hypothetical protein
MRNCSDESTPFGLILGAGKTEPHDSADGAAVGFRRGLLGRESRNVNARGQNDGVNHVDHTVATNDVGLNDLRTVDGHAIGG